MLCFVMFVEVDSYVSILIIYTSVRLICVGVSILDEISITQLPTTFPQIVGRIAPPFSQRKKCRCAGVRLTLRSFCAVGDMHSLIVISIFLNILHHFYVRGDFFKIHLLTYRSSSTLREILF